MKGIADEEVVRFLIDAKSINTDDTIKQEDEYFIWKIPKHHTPLDQKSVNTPIWNIVHEEEELNWGNVEFLNINDRLILATHSDYFHSRLISIDYGGMSKVLLETEYANLNLPSVSADALFFPAKLGRLSFTDAMIATTNELEIKWVHLIEGEMKTKPLVSTNGVICFVNINENGYHHTEIQFLDFNGSLKWICKLEKFLSANLCFATVKGDNLVVFYYNRVCTIDLATGKQILSKEFPYLFKIIERQDDFFVATASKIIQTKFNKKIRAAVVSSVGDTCIVTITGEDLKEKNWFLLSDESDSETLACSNEIAICTVRCGGKYLAKCVDLQHNFLGWEKEFSSAIFVKGFIDSHQQIYFFEQSQLDACWHLYGSDGVKIKTQQELSGLRAHAIMETPQGVVVLSTGVITGERARNIRCAGIWKISRLFP